MTVSTETARSGPYTGNGVTTDFPYTFRTLNEAWLRVTTVDAAGIESVLTLAADYTVTNVGVAQGGSVILTAPLPSGVRLVITRDVPATQEVDLENQGPFFAQTIEDSLDKLTMIVQQGKEVDTRSVSLAITSEGVSASLPDAVADNVLGWNAAATALENKVPNGEAFLVAPLANLTSDEATQLLNIGSTTISAAQWGFLGALTAQPTPLPGFISGLTLSNGVDTDHDLNVAVGVCTADDGSTPIQLASALSNVPMDATFSEGAGGGMVSGDSLPTNGTVHLFLIDGDGKTPKLLGSSSAGSGLSPTLPSGFTVKRRIGSLRTGGTANLAIFLQSGNSFRYVTSGTDANPQNVGTSRVAITVAAPTQIETIAAFNGACRRVAGTVAILFTALDEADDAAAFPRLSLATETTNGTASGQFQIKTNTSGQIGARSNTASTEVYVSITGWVDLDR